MLLQRKIFLILCASLTWNLYQCSPLGSEENLIGTNVPTGDTDIQNTNNVIVKDDQEANLTKSVNLMHDLLIKTSQLIILNSLDKKVDAIVANLEANNVTEMLNDFKQELLSEVRQMVGKSFKDTCEEPVTVQSLLDDGRDCTIKNRRFPEYFLAADGFDAGSERRQVFTWIPDGYHDYQCLWNLEKFEGYRGSNIKYKIKSVRYDEYLYAAGDDRKYDDQRRRVFTWKPKTTCEQQCYWDIQLVRQDNGATEQYFTIRNTEYGEYFYAVEGTLYDYNRRHAFTWKNNLNEDFRNDNQHQWIIKCK